MICCSGSSSPAQQAAVGTAGKWEMEHRHPTHDLRRLDLARTVELLARVNPEWATRQQAEWNEVLTRHPFVDGGAGRA